ncbi:hypothetical protein [Microbulbifer taiwanensis]|uniref:hypothetical protein n=1 Tax=Microbulbifer taiwanensis TaxID=986746 RepID=UPI0036236C0F
MHYVVLALVLLLAVAVSGMIARLSPLRLPLPLIQIAAGALLGGPLGVEIPLDPEIFFLLFIPRCCSWTAGAFPRALSFAICDRY